ncbi:TLC domain-containing protein 4-B-like [Saccoglossus kowalevskii]
MDTQYVPVVLASFGLSVGMYYYLSPVLSALLYDGYRKLSEVQLVDWNTRAASTLHSVLVSYMCVYVLLYDEDSKENPVWCKCRLAKITCAITTGYILADTLVMLRHFPLSESVFYILHHLCAIYAYTYTLLYGTLPYFANFRLLAEVSTPFVNLRWILDVTGYSKGSLFVIINGLMMCFSFFMVRIAVMPLYYYMMYMVWGTSEFYRLSFGMRLAWVITSVGLDIINVFWFSKIFRGAKKLVVLKKLELNNKKAA